MSRNSTRTRAKSSYILYVVGISAFLASLMQNIYSPIIPMLRDSFDVPISLVNLSVSLFILIIAVLQIVMGPIMDARGSYRLLISGLVLTVIASIGCALATHYPLFLLCRVLQAVGTASLPLVAVTTISSTFEGVERGHAMGTYQMLLSLAPAIAPVLGGFIGDHYGYAGIFWFLTGVSALMVALSVRYFPQDNAKTKKPVAIPNVARTYIHIAANKQAKPLMLIGFVYFFIYFIILVYLPALLIDHYGVGLSLVGLLYLPMALSNVAGTMIYKALQARWPRAALFICGNALAAVSLLLFAAMESFSILGLSIALFLFGMSGGVLIPLFTTMLSEAFESERASALGMFNFVRYAGMAAGPIFSGMWLAVLSDISLFFTLSLGYALLVILVSKPMWNQVRGWIHKKSSKAEHGV